MRRSLLTIGLWLALAGSLLAQSSTQRLTWEQPGISTLTEANALVYRLALDAAPALPVTPTCALVNTVISCSTPIAALSPGAHTLVLSVENGFGVAAATLTGTSPSAPVKLQITITVTVP